MYRFVRFLMCFLACASLLGAQQPQKIKINYPARTGTTWPLYIAKDGGYYAKYGLDVDLVFGVHPAGIAMLVNGEAVMTNYPLEQAMQAASKDGSLVAYASSFRKSLFALMSNTVKSVNDLKGKRIAVSQIGDAPYNYTVGILTKHGLRARDVQWVTVGTDVNGRVAALMAGRVDASMITAPVYFKLESIGYKSLANISDYDDIYTPTVFLFKKTTVAANPKLPELLIQAHAEAIKRLYDDKAFAVKTYLAYNKEDPADVEKVYDRYTSSNVYERVPYILAPAVKYVLDHPADDQAGAQMTRFDFRTVLDNSIVERLVKEGFFEKVFGPGIKTEEERKAKIVFR
jgi:ABC-type nitrate/sulfonate/bicarbonate transport system substrate-binding protein